jgi:hypothetical protein
MTMFQLQTLHHVDKKSNDKVTHVVKHNALEEYRGHGSGESDQPQAPVES